MDLEVIKPAPPEILIHSDDVEYQTQFCSGDYSEFRLWFTRCEDDIPAQLIDRTPQLAIVDISFVISDGLEVVETLKNQFDIPIILLINSGDYKQLPLGIHRRVDSIFTKPVRPEQLVISIYFNLARQKRNHQRVCSPRSCNVITQHLPQPDQISINHSYNQVLEKQDFILKLGGLLETIEDDTMPNCCAFIRIIDAGLEESPQWRYRSSDRQKKQFADAILKKIRYGDILALDDDYQYMMLFPGLSGDVAASIIRRILKTLFELIDGRESNENIAMFSGICVFDCKEDIGQIMTSAETALKEAAEQSNGEVVVNSILGIESEGHTKQVSYANIIRNALRDDEFFLHYQPIMSLSDHSIKHYEALIRLQDKNGDYIEPFKIISAAEHNDQIRGIDIYVFEQVMRKLTTLDPSKERIIFSVNLSGTYFGDRSLLQDICVLMDYYGIDPSQLVFEVTETAAVKDLEMASFFISSLKDLGCQFGLDDFGTGYASFSYLKALPVDYLKIDGSFVKDIVRNTADQLFVKAIVDVARGIGVKTIAEYVENKATLLLLKDLGVDFAQGYHIGKPGVLQLQNKMVPLSVVK